jgi:NADH dehydrogenase
MTARILVTGAHGYIGARLTEKLREAGHDVVTLCNWRLGEAVTFNPAPHAIIHLAHDWKNDDANLRGTALLLSASRSAGVKRLVLASSVAARPDALNRYGRVKAAIEATLTGPGEVAARIGMVYGGEPRAQWGMLTRLAKLPILPMLYPGAQVQPIHLDDLVEGLMRLATRERLEGRSYTLAGAPVAFGEFLRRLGRIRFGRAPLLIPIPSGLALALVDLAARVPGLPKVDRERILGLAGIRTQDSAGALAELSLRLRPLEEGLA